MMSDILVLTRGALAVVHDVHARVHAAEEAARVPIACLPAHGGLVAARGLVVVGKGMQLASTPRVSTRAAPCSGGGRHATPVDPDEVCEPSSTSRYSTAPLMTREFVGR
jgi:hypothetical protein